jgi:hypothetical protein
MTPSSLPSPGRQDVSGQREVSLDEITNEVKDLIANRLDKTVFVRSDSRAKYGDVVKAVDEVRSAGVDNLGLLTEKIRPQGWRLLQHLRPAPRLGRGCSA